MVKVKNSQCLYIYKVLKYTPYLQSVQIQRYLFYMIKLNTTQYVIEILVKGVFDLQYEKKNFFYLE